jgi:hypothetical protein
LKTSRPFLSSLVLGLSWALSNAALAQTTGLPPFDPASAWTITIDGGNRTFTLQLAGVAKEEAAGKRVLNGRFGFPGAPPADISVETAETPQGRTLSFVTPIGGRIAALQNQDGSFSGTVTPPTGPARSVSFQRLAVRSPADDDVVKVVSAAELKSQLIANVPASCAGFLGGWMGNWSAFGRAWQTWLWVVEIRPDCSAKYSHRSVPGKPTTFRWAKISEGTLSAKDSQGNVDAFELRGDEIWARHMESGQFNNAVFRKIADGER